MTKKKSRTLKARVLRKTLKVDLPLAVSIVKLIEKEDHFGILDLLRTSGFDVFPIITDRCLLDGDPSGYYSVSRNGIIVGKLEFDCCGIHAS